MKTINSEILYDGDQNESYLIITMRCFLFWNNESVQINVSFILSETAISLSFLFFGKTYWYLVLWKWCISVAMSCS